ncbi:MAG: type II secretion system protein GspE [Phycisphaeraceae bacterium]|nr:type II secretion system protein GspE [Phycisphaeraceae bacterium]
MLENAEFLERALLEEGLIDEEQLRQSRELALEVGCSIDEAIETLKYVEGRRIALTKAQIFEVPYVDLRQLQIHFPNCQHLPYDVADRFLVFPIFMVDGLITLGTSDPLNLTALDQVRQIVKCDVDTVQCETKLLRELINRAYSLSNHSAAADVDLAAQEDGVEVEQTGQIISAVNTLLADAIDAGASDVHVNPDQNELHIRLRIDGMLHKTQGPPLNMHPKIVQRLKVMAQLDLTQTRRPQDGKIRFEHNDRRIDVRVSIIPTITGENVVLRLLNNNTAILSFEDLGFAPDIITTIEQVISRPHGMLLVTGPTGSGKTTTLYTAIAKMNRPDRNIITIEDPVEIRLPLIRQVQINHEIGLTFAGALRSVLRQDPDMILVGEVRDEETASIALQASLTGHFVLSTLHTNDAAGSVARLLDFGLPPFVINSAVLGVVAQRLVRRVCGHCAGPAEPDVRLLSQFGLHSAAGLLAGTGCTKCMQTGHHGRVGVYEMLAFTPLIEQVVGNGGTHDEIRDAAISEGMELMWKDALAKARRGLTTLGEVEKLVSVIETSQCEDEVVRRKSA